MNIFKTPLFIAVAATAILAAGTADAATKSSTFKVKMTVDGSCEIISTKDVNFANRFANAGPVSAQGEVAVQCTNGQAFNVQLDGGNAGSIAARKMVGANPANTVSYQLYSDSSASKVWGNTLGTDTVDRTGTGFGSASTFNQVLTVYGVATLVGNEKADTYSDTVTATINF
ncbi:spore coat protein U domain-containing protein [Lysobacter ciconiae]|uniref:Spore coat protein U domain-containing protein n=1 Tax=Novilysobacter ciconiae TaxID=2781022 RepID=A0A7S6ZRM3_9GAMM|nr:spore coat U domain-containing protein [Lysobacter ciconiae]QOW18872.1 spore coat protein U domain-containing protein [Lysobacter ciconiae]